MPVFSFAGEGTRPTLTLYGSPGLIDMPSAEHAPDATLSATVSTFGGSTRTTLSFQILPRLSGSFRYSRIQNFLGVGVKSLYDRSFDLRYRLIDEGQYIPAVTVGMQDFIGTGVYSAEYIAATKTLHPNLKATVGLGWGRLGGVSGYANRTINFGVGGNIDSANWFRGNVAVFGGLEWRTPLEGLNLKVEYSSDHYVPETIDRALFVRNSQVNFAADYRVSDSLSVAAYYLYGSEFGLSASISLNPKHPAAPGSLDPSPLPIKIRQPVRGQAGVYDTTWTQQADGRAILASNLETLLAAQGQQLESLHVTADTAFVRFRNIRNGTASQAIGRVARILTHILPASVETFVIVPVVEGLPVSAITLRRSDLEDLEFRADGVELSWQRAQIGEAAAQGAGSVNGDIYPNFSWALAPYGEVALFDPDKPVRVDVGVRLTARYEVSPGLVFSGSLRKKFVGNLDSVTRASNSVLQHVRSDYGLYDKQGDPALERLTAEYFFRPGDDFYGRVSVGYLEKMYGGVSAEVLWKPVTSKLGFGAELNYVKQRNFDQLLGFQTYEVVTGHASAYWDMGNGFYSQLDAGRYLAGDWGATYSLDRVFDNGWKVGAFLTLTDVPFATFGEGSFDKGIKMTIPLSWASGQSSRKRYDMTIRPITRDGGARLNVENRLYGLVSDYHRAPLDRSWGRFWR